MPAASAPPVLVTGAAGFIGHGLAERLLDEGVAVLGVDSLNAYYDPRLKRARLARLEDRKGFAFKTLDLANRAAAAALFDEVRPRRVVHLAAQAGVRYSLENPHAYVASNLEGFMNILEGCRHHGVDHLVYASSSSVYGLNTRMPFKVTDNVDHPVSLYAATKKANELMAHSYSHLYGLPTTGLRFFTVYGPWMRPDMVPFVFAERMVENQPIKVFNGGRMKRDFTYIDDIVEGVRRILDIVPAPDPAWSGDAPNPASSPAPYRLYNIGNSRPEELMEVIGRLERAMGIEAVKEYLPMQPGDVPATFADVEDLTRVTGFRPQTPLAEGIDAFARWHRDVWRGDVWRGDV